MKLIDRREEMARLDSLVGRPSGTLGVLWGRRRIGKSRLLVEWSARHGGLYTVADQSASPVLRRYMAQTIAARFSEFADAEYPDWRSLLNRLAAEAKSAGWRGPWIMDELPYVVAASPEFPSVFQRWIDNEAKNAGLVVAVAGSSQRMMQGLVLDGSAPLYGRATELFELKPLKAGYIGEALGLKKPGGQVEHFAAWGGTPRYWELVEGMGADLDEAVDRLVLDPSGPLHTEPDRMLIEEMPPATALRPLLDAIGMGAGKVTEIGGRVGQSATSLARPLERLRGLGLVEREIPHGESERDTKRSRYRISDPFFRMWFRTVAPNRSFLAGATAGVRLQLWQKMKPGLIAETWEDLCRASVPSLAGCALSALGPWKPAGRYWHGGGPEWDIVAFSVDGRRLLVGEAKWSERRLPATQVKRLIRDLEAKGPPPVAGSRGLEIVRAVFVPSCAVVRLDPRREHVVNAGPVLASLR